MESRQEELRRRWEAAGQEQVFRFWPDLDAAARAGLFAQLASIAIEEILEAHRQAIARPAPDLAGCEPVELDLGTAPAPSALGEAGEARLAEGRVAVLTVAGGEGTRLGFDGPKGAFPIGPVSDRSLFALFAQRIAGLARRHGRTPPWYVMTSPATDAATRRFFAERGNLGLPAGSVRFFVQGTLPVLDLEGRVLLEAPDRVAEAPDGHGGVFAALLGSGALAEMAAAGIGEIFYHHVDNPLARIADPVYLGLHATRGAEMSCKAVEKRAPDEQMGFLFRRAGRTELIEYSEVPAAQAGARDPDGRLRHRLGSVGIHVLDRAFAERVAQGEPLPLHVARKPVPAADPRGRTRSPEAPNAHKLERFVFDALARAGSVAVMETRRGDEYSPVKNAAGEASPATARRDLTRSYRRWIADAGLETPGEDVEIEMDHSQFDGPNDLRRSGLRGVMDCAPGIRIAMGAQ